MANYATLKAAIEAAIYENGNNEITGNVLQQSLLSMISSLGDGYQFIGIATPTTNPGTPDANVFYLASTAGTYTNFGGLVLADGEIALLTYNGTWVKNLTGAASAVELEQLQLAIAPKEMTATGANNAIVCRIPLALSAGEDLYIKYSATSENFSCLIRAHYTDGTFGVIKDNAIGEYNGLFTLEKNADYIEAVRYLTPAVNGESVTLNIILGLTAEIVSDLDEIKDKLPPIENIAGKSYTGVYTTSANPVYINMPVSFSAGEKVYIDVDIDSLSMHYVLRFVTSQNTFVAVTTARGNSHHIVELPEDVVTLQFANAISGVEGINVTLHAYTGVEGQIDASDKEIENLNNSVGWKFPLSYFEIGSIETNEAGITGYSGNIQRVRTRQGLTLHFNEGDIIGLTDYSNAMYILYWTDTDGFHRSNWYHKDYEIENEGDYTIMFAHSPIADVSGVAELGGLFFVKRKDGLWAYIEDNVQPSPIPTYYKEYLADKSKAMRDAILGQSSPFDTFIFISDVHWNANAQNSPKLIGELLNKGMSQKVIFGGDVCSAVTPSGESWVQPKEIEIQMNFNGIVRESGCMYNLRGNHDFNGSKNNIVPGNPGAEYYGWPIPVTRELISGPLYADPNAHFPSEGTYYYVDDPIRKIRYICLYAIIANDYTASQEDFLISSLSGIPEGYNVIVFNHDGIAKTTSLECYNTCPDIPQLVFGFARRESGVTTTFGKTFDFTGATSKLLAVFSGHTHTDLQTFVDDIPNIAIGCDALYSHTLPFLGETIFTRSRGTVYEQCFDHVVIDNGGNVICTRFGAGGNRKFVAESQEITINSSINLTTSLTNAEWGSYNNDTDWYSGNSSTPATPSNTRVSVIDGQVTGISSGRAVVYAKDENGNREFFNILVN